MVAFGGDAGGSLLGAGAAASGHPGGALLAGWGGGGSGIGRSAVGLHRLGNSRALAGVVR